MRGKTWCTPPATPALLTSCKNEVWRWDLQWLGLLRKASFCKARQKRSVFAPEMPQGGVTQWYGCSMEKRRAWRRSAGLCQHLAEPRAENQTKSSWSSKCGAYFSLFYQCYTHLIPSDALSFPDAPQWAWRQQVLSDNAIGITAGSDPACWSRFPLCCSISLASVI